MRTLIYIRKQVKHLCPDSILCFTKFYAALANLALLGTKYKIVLTERSSPLYKWPKRVELFSKVSFYLKKPRGVISQTGIASIYHRKYYGKTQFAVIPNPVRKPVLFPEIKREKIIFAVGRFHDDCKGFDLLVKAFNEVQSLDWKLVFAGGTKDEGEYLLKLANQGKKDRIEFLGEVKDMDKLYARAGIFVMPSRSEGFPNALAEAMASGCACISFDFIAGPRDIINHGKDGLIVPDGDIRALAEAVDSLIDNSEQRASLGKTAKGIADRFSQEKIARMHVEFLFPDLQTYPNLSD